MNERTKIALADQSLNIERYIKEVREYNRISANELEDIANMLAKVDHDEPTDVGYADLMDAYAAKGRAKVEYDNFNEPWEYARGRMADLRHYILVGERRGYDADKLNEAADEIKRLDKELDGMCVGDFQMTLDGLRKAYGIAKLTFKVLETAHVRQCATVAAKALLEDTSWTKQPTRYKRMRAKAEQIANAALLGTGCELTAYESGSLHINHSYYTYFTGYNHSNDYELTVHDYGKELPSLKRLEYETSCKYDGETYETIRATIATIYDARDELQRLMDEYKEKENMILKPFNKLDVCDDRTAFSPSLREITRR